MARFGPWMLAALRVSVCIVPLSAALGADHVWLVGGGFDVESSQAQIEQNVLWVRSVLRHLPGNRELHVFFTDGLLPTKDVTEWAPPSEDPMSLQPLARVFNAHWTNGLQYRNHRVPGIEGGTRASVLAERLAASFRVLSPGDRALFVFNGHGSHGEKSSLDNTIELWDSTQLTVADMDRLFSLIPAEVPVRYVFTQCYSGAFAHLARPGTNRCGFMAEAADQPAEGCSASLDLGDYRDYTTDLFAALLGEDRQGRPLRLAPDRDGDGRVSLREAHLYAFAVSRSADVPRSTSEAYLESWLPWYLAWVHWIDPGGSDNEYRRMAAHLARAVNLDSQQDLPAQLRARRGHLAAQADALREEQEQEISAISEVRETIEAEVLARWPEAANAYTQGFARFLERDRGEAQDLILRHSDYPALRRHQDSYWVLEEKLLENERSVAVLDRIERAAWLGRLRVALERFGSHHAQRRYQRLLACEELEP